MKNEGKIMPDAILASQKRIEVRCGRTQVF